MRGTVPVMRVNYTIAQLIGGLFVTEKTCCNRERLKEMVRIFFSVDDVLLTSSARCAIYMIVSSLPQKKVIIPTYTCEVVVEAIKLAGKEVVFASVNKETLNISCYPEIDSDTIVLATHQYGHPCEMYQLSNACKEKGAILIEDCAGSFGSRIDGKLTGTFGDYGVFSFSASKTIHSPTKGGFIIARNKNLLDNVLPISDQPKDFYSFKLKQLAKGIGFCIAKNRMLSSWLFNKGQANSDHSDTAYLTDSVYHRGMYEWQAYVVLKQFGNIESIMMERRNLFKHYYNGINNAMITCMSPCIGGVFIRFAIFVKDRDRFAEHCRKNGIAIGSGYNRLYCSEEFVSAFEISNEIVYLPFGNGYSDKEIEKIISVVNSFK